MRSALIYEWLVTHGGGEKTLASIAELFPSPIYALVKDQHYLNNSPFAQAQVRTSFLQKFPRAERWYRYYLPLFSTAVETFDLSGYDMILSVSHAVAKGGMTQPHQLHLCYCLTPMRYAWDLQQFYLHNLGFVQKSCARMALHQLRKWDVASAHRVDHFATISHYVASRIKRIYGRESEVIYPPVDVEKIALCEKKGEYFLTVSRLVPYKNVELIVEAFSKLPDKRLIVIGDGPEMNAIKKKATANVEILGFQPESLVQKYLQQARAFIFAAEEDFGIAPLEAQAAGTPVIALGKGATLETVIDEETGVFFEEPTICCLIEAIKRFEVLEFDPKKIRKNAERFSTERFKQEFAQFVHRKLEAHHEIVNFSRR